MQHRSKKKIEYMKERLRDMETKVRRSNKRNQFEKERREIEKSII